MKKALFTLVMGLGLNIVALGSEPGTVNYAAEVDSEPKVEFGVTVGTPAALNLNVGIWGPKRAPLVVRASGMYFGETRGLSVDLGAALVNEPNFRLFSGLNYSNMRVVVPDSLSRASYEGIGPTLGMNLYGFSLQTGLSFGSGDSVSELGIPSKMSSPQLLVQVGYTLML